MIVEMTEVLCSLANIKSRFEVVKIITQNLSVVCFESLHVLFRQEISLENLFDYSGPSKFSIII